MWCAATRFDSSKHRSATQRALSSPLEMPPLSNLSDGQTSELMSLFKFFDTDGDGLISPRSMHQAV